MIKQFTYPKGWAWLFPLCLIILSCPRGRHFKGQGKSFRAFFRQEEATTR